MSPISTPNASALVTHACRKLCNRQLEHSSCRTIGHYPDHHRLRTLGSFTVASPGTEGGFAADESMDIRVQVWWESGGNLRVRARPRMRFTAERRALRPKPWAYSPRWFIEVARRGGVDGHETHKSQAISAIAYASLGSKYAENCVMNSSWSVFQNWSQNEDRSMSVTLASQMSPVNASTSEY